MLTTKRRVMPPTTLFNEGWLLCLALDWFAVHPSVRHPLEVPSGASWYSGAFLPTRFAPRFRGDALAESYTHADGVVGHFRIGGSGEGDLVLAEGANHFAVIEAKVKSRLSAGTKNAPGFDQAARNIACIAQTIANAGATSDAFHRLGFFVVAPACQIGAGVFEKELDKTSVKRKVERRMSAYDDARMSEWYEMSFLPTLDATEIASVSWEGVVETMLLHDPETADWFSEFYDNCLFYNRLTA